MCALMYVLLNVRSHARVLSYVCSYMSCHMCALQPSKALDISFHLYTTSNLDSWDLNLKISLDLKLRLDIDPAFARPLNLLDLKLQISRNLYRGFTSLWISRALGLRFLDLQSPLGISGCLGV